MARRHLQEESHYRHRGIQQREKEMTTHRRSVLIARSWDISPRTVGPRAEDEKGKGPKGEEDQTGNIDLIRRPIIPIMI